MSSLLIFPSGNTFTHLLECTSIGGELQASGHEISYGISKHYASWAREQKLRHFIIPELWERGPTDHPSVSWFIDRDYVSKCVHEEINLIDQLRPDYVLANFKYTSGISARAANTPLISMNILSMLPEIRSNFGYLPGDVSPASLQQQKQLHFFDTFSCSALNSVAEQIGLNPFLSMSDCLDGDWVLIPDSPFFHREKVSSLPGHYVPVNFLHREKTPPELQILETWSGKTDRKAPDNALFANHKPNGLQHKNSAPQNVLLALGSSCRSQELLVYLIAARRKGPWSLSVSISGENSQFFDELKRDFPEVKFASFFDIQLLAQTGLDLYVCHGGLGSIYDGLRYGIPTLIIPQQPEQDHNGMLAEQLGIGTRLWPSHPFNGKVDFYKQKLFATSEVRIREKVLQILDDESYCNRIEKAKKQVLKEVCSFPHPGAAVQRIITRDKVTAWYDVAIEERGFAV